MIHVGSIEGSDDQSYTIMFAKRKKYLMFICSCFLIFFPFFVYSQVPRQQWRILELSTAWAVGREEGGEEDEIGHAPDLGNSDCHVSSRLASFR